MAEVKSRREEYSEATRQALVDSAVELFAERGYTRTSLDEIAAAARVTKGALYHYFGGKQSVFMAAFDQVETNAMEEVVQASGHAGDAWDAALLGMDTFLDRCGDPIYGRLAIQEAPAVMGFSQWRECEEKYAYGLTSAFVRALVDEELIKPLPVDAAARVAFGILSAAALAITEVEGTEQQRVVADMKLVVRRFLRGL